METTLGTPEAIQSESDKFLADKALQVAGFLKAIVEVTFMNHFETTGSGANRKTTNILAPQPLGQKPTYDVNLCRGEVVLNLESKDFSTALRWGFSLWKNQRKTKNGGNPFLRVSLAQGKYEKVTLDDDLMEALHEAILKAFVALPEDGPLKANLKKQVELTRKAIDAKASQEDSNPSRKASGSKAEPKLVSAGSF